MLALLFSTSLVRFSVLWRLDISAMQHIAPFSLI